MVTTESPLTFFEGSTTERLGFVELALSLQQPAEVADRGKSVHESLELRLCSIYRKFHTSGFISPYSPIPGVGGFAAGWPCAVTAVAR